MPQACYYFVSALPALQLDRSPPFSSEEFLRQATGVFSPDVVEELSRVELIPRQDTFCWGETQWRNFETFLRNAVARHRGAGIGTDYRVWQREEGDVFPGVRRYIEEAMNLDSAVDRERRLDQLRWNFLDGICVGREYTFDAVVVFRVQLLLAEKWNAVSEQNGREQLKNVINNLKSQAEKARQEALSQ